jgi:hypothetical protein
MSEMTTQRVAQQVNHPTHPLYMRGVFIYRQGRWIVSSSVLEHLFSTMSKTAPPLAPPTEEQLAEAEDFKQTSDFANYFCTYAFIYHQKQMLEDRNRMDGYYNGIMKNKACFEGKVVLDVGTGACACSLSRS